MPVIQKVSGAQIGGRATAISPVPGRAAVQASSDRPIPVPPRLMEAFRSAGIERPEGAGDRLSDAQVAALTEGRSIEERIEFKALISQLGLQPLGQPG